MLHYTDLNDYVLYIIMMWCHLKLYTHDDNMLTILLSHIFSKMIKFNINIVDQWSKSYKLKLVKI